MSGYTKENQCRNFAPNIFNKNKCQNCFKPRETHLLSDKDLNKATPIYVGWLLLAPIGTDFSNPTHRNRKWQRRYFILFEHGALRYALDDNANTLPQGTINMNQCTDVVHAESMTGQKYSLCIYHPEMKYFIRSESRDDTTGWYDQLIIFPQTIKETAMNKKKISRRFPSAKATAATVGESSKKLPPVTYDTLRSPKLETPPNERIISPPVDSQIERKGSDLKRGRSISRKSTDKKQGTQTTDVQRPVRRAKSLDRDSHDLNDFTIESLSQRKGWILKRRNYAKETWTKHWFVLSENSLKYYKDPASEEFGQADGEIRLDDIIRVEKVELSENYGFTIYTVSEEITLAAVTTRIRQGWINTIENSTKAISEKENSEKIVTDKVPDVFDERMVERSMEKRARKRQRRKMGRSRTYDFSELRSVRNTVDTRSPQQEKSLLDSELTETQKKEIDDLLQATSRKSEEDVKIEENGLDSPDGTKGPVPLTRSSKQASVTKKTHPKRPLTTKMFNDTQWDKIEKNDKTDKPSIIATCNSLKSEVEFMAKQIELGKKEFEDVLAEQKRKIEKSEKEDPLKGEVGTVEDASSDKLRALEIAHKCAMDENKRLRDEIVQSRMAKEQDTTRMNAKIRDLKMQLAMVDKRSRIKSSLKSHKNDRSLKDKVSELEAEMEDTGQMIDRRLTALETPRRKETDDSDEAGSSSSCSSLNVMMRVNRADEEKSEPKKVNLDAMHQKFSDSIKSLQEARNSPEYSTSAVQETFNANKASVLILQKKIVEDQRKWLAVINRLHDLRSKISDIQAEKSTGSDTRDVLSFLESELNNVLKTMEKGVVSHEADSVQKPKVPDPKEVEAVAVERLKTLSENLKTNIQPTYSVPLAPNGISSINTSNDFETMPFELKDKVFAQQLSHEAMIIADMAETLERYASGKQADVSSALLHSDTKNVLFDNQATTRTSSLLQHAGIVVEKVLLQSRLVNELSKLQSTSSPQSVQPDFKSASLPTSVSYGKTSQGSFSSHQGVIDGASSLSLVQAQINYLLHVYNDRIARLSQDVKEAQHRADSFQQKLVELVHACKTKDIEVVSQLALEVDTKASLVSTVDELPEWRRQVDYGMLHGAEASISTIDLQKEASFFAKLSEDISRMSSDVKSLANIGSQILEIDLTLSRILKPSVIGEHASVIAYEAISQAQLIFLTRRISKDYEEQIIKMKSAVRKQTAHCENLQQKLQELENSDDIKMQQLKTEYQQKVDRLMKELSLVEQARKEMSTETDQKLNKLDLKQKRELERSEAQHRKETDELRNELKESKSCLQIAERQHKKEVVDLEKQIAESEMQHKLMVSSIKDEYETSLNKEKKKLRKQMEELSSNDAKRIEKMKSEFRKELESVILSHDKTKSHIEEDKQAEFKVLKETHRRELENLKYDHEKEIEDIKADFEEALKEKQDLLDSLKDEKTKEQKHDVEIDELQSFFERRFSNFEETHKRQLEDMAKGYQFELKRLEDEKAKESAESSVSTRLAIESMKKYYHEEVEKMKEDTDSEDSSRILNQYDKVSKEFEALSEMYSKKCAEISSKDEDIKNLHGQLIIVEENNEVLEKQNKELSSKLEDELGEMKSSSLIRTHGEESDNVHHLKVELGAKKLEVTILHQQMESLKQQVAMTLQGRFLHSFDVLSREDLSSKKGVFRSSSERRAASKVNFDD